MKPPALTLVRPRDLDHALELMGGEDVRPLAGGQSLGAALNLRLEAP
tara:strand:- start:3 stop:143 length:141 start_codon:yes stop_codon:yes gene_type:complete